MQKTKKLLYWLIAMLICSVMARPFCLTGANAEGENPEADKVTVNGAEYTLADSMTEFDFLGEDNMMSHWGNQPITLSYDAAKGTMTAQANQRIDQSSSNGSYHTKFRIYLEAGGNFMSFFLRQNSGEKKEVGGKQIDNGVNNGYELYTGDNGFQVFDVRNGVRSNMIKWFQYAEKADEFKSGKAFYDFEIWVLNLSDGTVQFVVNVGGANKWTMNTSESELFGEAILEGGIRFGADDCSLKTVYTEYGVEPKDDSKDENGNFKLADSMTELIFGKEENFRAAWGNQEATVVFSENNVMHCKANQEINSVVDTGSYHTKFKMTVDSDDPNQWVSLMLRQSVRTAVAGGTCGLRNGYGMFFTDGGIQLMKWADDAATPLTWFRFEPDDAKYPTAVKTIGNAYTFEIWMLNLENGSVQIIISVNDNVVCNINDAINPVLNGYFRVSQPDSVFQAYYQGYDEIAATTVKTGDPGKTEYLPTDRVDVSDVKAVTTYGEVVGVSYTAGANNVEGLNLRQTGEQSVKLVLPNLITEYTFTVNKIDSAVYAIKEGSKKNYLKGEAFADDIIVTRTVGEDVNEIKILPSEITGFDTTESGEKTLTVKIEGVELTMKIEVAEYILKQGYKAEYLKDEAYANDIIVIKKVGEKEEANEIAIDSITGFDTATTGEKTLTFEFVVPFTVKIEVAQYTMNEDFKQSYLVGEEYAEDIVVTKTVGEKETTHTVTLSDLTGFDTQTSGVKTVVVTVGAYRAEIEIEVAEFVVKEGYKTEYKVGEEFANDIEVVRKVGETETKVSGVTVEGFDSSAEGEITLTVKANGKTYSVTVNVTAEQSSEAPAESTAENGGCFGSVGGTTVLTVFLMALATGAIVLRKKEQNK